MSPHPTLSCPACRWLSPGRDPGDLSGNWALQQATGGLRRGHWGGLARNWRSALRVLGEPEGSAAGRLWVRTGSAGGSAGGTGGLQRGIGRWGGGGVSGGEAGVRSGEAGVRSRAVGYPAGCPRSAGGRPPRRGALTCFPAAAARDFCRNCRSRGSEGAAETVPRARAMESRARAHWRRQDSISPAGRARGGGGGAALTAPLRLGSGVGDLLAARRLYKPFS